MQLHVRKSRDYVYEIWKYKWLIIEKLFQSKIMREENDKKNLSNIWKQKLKARN